jgi:hypothetical protein
MDKETQQPTPKKKNGKTFLGRQPSFSTSYSPKMFNAIKKYSSDHALSEQEVVRLSVAAFLKKENYI